MSQLDPRDVFGRHDRGLPETLVRDDATEVNNPVPHRDAELHWLPIDGAVPLRLWLGLVLLVHYGTRITVGAGIYVLVGGRPYLKNRVAFPYTHIDLPQAELGQGRHRCYSRSTPEDQPCDVQPLLQRCCLLP
jgi:hypothetical protein